jgi:hypothetical protein
MHKCKDVTGVTKCWGLKNVFSSAQIGVSLVWTFFILVQTLGFNYTVTLHALKSLFVILYPKRNVLYWIYQFVRYSILLIGTKIKFNAFNFSITCIQACISTYLPQTLKYSGISGYDVLVYIFHNLVSMPFCAVCFDKFSNYVVHLSTNLHIVCYFSIILKVMSTPFCASVLLITNRDPQI